MAIKIIGDNTPLYAQGYFLMIVRNQEELPSHLRFGKTPIKSTYLVYDVDFVSCHNKSYIYHYDILKGLKDGGTFVLNCPWSEDELNKNVPSQLKKHIKDYNINFYIIDAEKIAHDIGLGSRINMIMQAAFFKLIDVMPIEEAVGHLKEFVEKTYGRKGEEIVKLNYQAIERGIDELVKVDTDILQTDHTGEKEQIKEEPKFIKDIQRPMARLDGDDLSTSAFMGIEDGTFL